MHLRQQHISGKANGPECVVVADLQGRRYIIYASHRFVIVHTDEFVHVQTFEGVPDAKDTVQEDRPGYGTITCLSVCSANGQIAAASSASICVWQPIPSKDDEPPQWRGVASIDVGFVPRTMDWSKDGTLFVGGSSLALVTLEQTESDTNWACKVAFHTSVAGDIIRGRFSPDGTILATYGEHDRLVKLWFRRALEFQGSSSVSYDFTYLPHARGVVYAEWRRTRKDVKYAEENVLLTMSQDNICRLWSQASTESPSKFFMCCLIDVSQTPASLNVNEPEMVAIHWQDQQELFAALSMRIEMEERGLNAIRKARRISAEDTWKVKKLKDTLKDNPDMLMQIQRDGTVVLWGIQHLVSQPRRMPKVVVLMKIKSALQPSDYEFFKDTPHIFQNENVIRSSGVFLPSEIYFVTVNHAGVVNVYLKNLDEFFAISRDSSRIRLVRSFGGHRMSPTKFVRHPVLDISASIGKDGELNFWKVTVPEIGVRFSEGLDFIAALPPDVAPRRLAWFPQVPILLIAGSTGIAAYSVTDDVVAPLDLRFEGWDGDNPFIMLQVYIEPPTHDAANDGRSTAIIIGICEDAQTLIWSAELHGENVTRIVLVDNDELDLPSGVSLKYASPTNAIVSVYSPTAPLGAHLFLTYTDDHSIRFWHTRDGTLACLLKQGVRTKFRTSSETVLGQDIEFGTIKRVKASPFGKVALLYTRGKQDVIYILDYGATGTGAREEGEIVFDEPVIDLDWNLTADAQLLLAVAVGTTINVYCPHRVDAIGLYFNIFNAPLWKIITTIRLQRDLGQAHAGVGRCLAWMNNGLIIFATDREITCYSKWLSDETMVSKPGATGQLRELTVFQKASKVNGRLQDHHPMLLIQYLLWGKYEYVKYILSFVLRYARLMADAKREMRDIPVPLWKLFGKDSTDSGVNSKDALYDQLFSSSEAALGEEDELHVEGQFTPQNAEALLELLTSVSLPGIDSNEQLILMAVIDTVMQSEQARRSLDENGIRYLLYLRLNLYLAKLSPTKNVEMHQVDIFWAYHSESQDILYETCVTVAGGKLLWPQVRAFGMGYWMKNLETLKRTFEILGRNHFKVVDEGDPVGCALFFAALKKKNLLLALWKTTPDTAEKATMLKFLSNDFNEARWQTAAAKNAFALMSRQRFEYAVAFFLLGNRLRDAVSVCLKQLEDVQLAFAITRIYEGDDSELLKEIVMLHVLPRALATQDRWSASMAFSLLGDREKAILSLLIPLDILNEDKPCPPVTKELLAALNDPALLVGYVFLKRQYASVRYFPDVPQDVETEFIYQTVAAYERIGCPGLALSILQQFDDWLPQPDISLLDEESRSRSPSADRFMTSTIPRRGSFALDSGLSDWGALSAVSKAAGQFRRGSKTSDDLNESPGSRRKSQVSLDYFDKHEVQRSETGTLLTVPTLGVPEKERAEDFDWSQPIVRNQVEDTYVSTLLLDEPDLEETIEIPLQGEPGSVSVSKALGSEAKAPAMDRKTAFTFLMENKNSRLFQWFLGMRLVQAATTSTTNVCDNLDVLKDDPLFAAFFDRMQEGLHGMSEAIGMPLDVLDRVINLRCREADVFRAYIELLPLYGDLESYTEKLSLFMVQECNTVARLAFEVAREALPQVFVEFIASFSRRLLASLNRWQEKSSSSSHDATAQSFIPQVAVTAFVALVLCANVMRDFSLVNQLVQSSTGFFNALRSRDFPALYSVIGAVLSGDFVPDTPDASYEHESDTEFDDVTAEFKPKTKTADNITADNLVFYAALTQTAHKLGDFLLVLEESGSDILYSFVRDGLLRPLSTLLYRLQTSLLTSPLFIASGGRPTLAQVTAQFRGPGPRRLWSAISKVSDTNVMFDVLVAHVPVASNGGHKEHETDVVFRTPDIVGSLAINPLDENVVAIASTKGVFEVDVDASIFYLKNFESADSFGDESPTSPRKIGPEFSSLTRNKSASMKVLADVDTGLRLKRNIPGVSCVEPHPTLNYYLAGVSEQATEKNPPYVSLYQFGQPDPLIHYNARGLARITRLRFDPVGHVFGASDAAGNLTLWRFESQEKAALPFTSFPAHTTSVHDFCFLGSTTLIATGGLSAGNANVCIWDTLLPTSRARVKTFNVHEGGTYCLAYASRHQLLFSGGKKGDICIYDMRQRTLLNTLQAHSLLVKTLAIDEDLDIFISGSTDGDLKAWSLKGFGRKDTWSNVHHTSKVLRLPSAGRSVVGTYGVMEVVARGSFAFTCGADGSVRRNKISEM